MPLLIGVPIAAIVLALSLAFMPRTSSAEQAEIAAYNAKVAAEANDLVAKRAAEEQAAKEARTIDIAFPADGRPLEVLLVGDSLSNGMYSSSEATSFRMLVQTELAKSGPVKWHDLNQPGATTKVIAEKPSPATNLDLAIVELSTNDHWSDTPIDQFTAAYAGYLDKLRSESPNVKFLCLGPWNKADAGTVELEKAINEQCVSRGGKFASLSELAANRPYNSTQGTQSWKGLVADSSHPSDAGHYGITELILSHLGKLTGA